jgi:hypothetical protein
MTGRVLVRTASALLLAASFAAPAAAQTQAPQNPVQPQPRDPNMPSPQNTIPEKVDSTGSTGTLSDKLEKSEGVIRPSGNIDPGITVRPPVPNPGTTPVITPPGEPGGNQRVQPK